MLDELRTAVPLPAISLTRQAAFAVMFATAAAPAWISMPERQQNPVSTVREVNRSLTVQREYKVANSDWNSSTMTERFSHDFVSPTVNQSDWSTLAGMPEAWANVLEEIREYSDLDAGWRGLGSLGVANNTIEQASFLASNLADRLPAGPAPMVGADDDGNIVFTWDHDALIGNLEIRGNEYYSYYFKRNARVEKSAKVPIYAAPREELVAFLLS